jgi:hypothetical protein
MFAPGDPFYRAICHSLCTFPAPGDTSLKDNTGDRLSNAEWKITADQVKNILDLVGRM